MKNKLNSGQRVWDKRFLRLAREVSTWSKDVSTKCGAVTSKGKRLISIGFNGFPSGCNDNIDLYQDRETKYLRVQHAERNAILFAKQDLFDCSIYIYPMPPCSQCAGGIIQAGIKRIITIEPTQEQEKRWGKDFKESEKMFQEARRDVIFYSLQEINTEINNEKKH